MLILSIYAVFKIFDQDLFNIACVRDALQSFVGDLIGNVCDL